MATTKMCAWHTGIMGHTSYKTTIYNDHRIALNFRVHCSALSTDPLHHPHSQQGAFKFSPAPPPGRAALMGGGGLSDCRTEGVCCNSALQLGCSLLICWQSAAASQAVLKRTFSTLAARLASRLSHNGPTPTLLCLRLCVPIPSS